MSAVSRSMMDASALLMSDADISLLARTPECMDSMRLDTVYKFLSLQSPTDRYDVVSIFENEELLHEIVVNGTDFLLRYEGSGNFKGVSDAAEYEASGRMEVNGNRWGVMNATLTDLKCQDRDSVIVGLESSSFVIGQPLQQDEYREYLFMFATNSSKTSAEGHQLLHQVDTTVPDTIVEVMQNSIYDRRVLCDATVLTCPGELYPYSSLQECYDLTATIPDICPTQAYNYTNGVLTGDTMACRYLHFLFASLRPTIHCAHLRNESEKCLANECPAAIRLLEPVMINPVQNVGLPKWLRYTEVASLIILAMFSFCTFFWFRRRRRFDLNYSAVGFDEPSEHYDQRMSTAHGTGETGPHPTLRYNKLRLEWANVKDANEAIVLDLVKEGYLGGCTLTCITGETGSGKSSLIKLLCGFQQPHMALSAEWKSRSPVGFCPQSSEMWPNEMYVRDILAMACEMASTDISTYSDSFQTLGLALLLDQCFGSLSGGQKQRVNIAVAVIRPEPTVIFLDEPLAALDEKNAIACLRTLKTLPVRHAFVLTVHNASERVNRYFERILDFRSKRGLHDLVEVSCRGNVREQNVGEIYENDVQRHIPISAPFFASMRASLILWYGQYFGFPFVEVLVFVVTVIGGVVVGCLARKSMVDWGEHFLPTEEGARIAFYLADVLVGMAFITSFGVSIIYTARERVMLHHFLTLRSLHTGATFVVLMVFRSLVNGILQGFCWVVIALPLMGLSSGEFDTILVNTILFGFAWTGATYASALLVPAQFSTHVVMIVDVLSVFFCGAFFFMDDIYSVFYGFHFANPLMYILSANLNLLGQSLNTNCDPIQHPGECASGQRLVELVRMDTFQSGTAQLFSLGFLLIFFCVVWLVWHPWTSKERKIHETSGDASVIRSSNKRRSSFARSRPSFSQTRTSFQIHLSQEVWGFGRFDLDDYDNDLDGSREEEETTRIDSDDQEDSSEDTHEITA